MSGINFDKEKIEKQKELRDKADRLRKIQIKWGSVKNIKCGSLKNFSTDEAKEKWPMFDDTKKFAALYFFEIVSKHSNKSIVDALKKYKIEGDRKCPKVSTKSRAETKYLYCGSVKKDLRVRFIQHMGYGSKNTYALQLFHWAKRIGLILEFHYGFFNSKDEDCSEILESALAKKVKPLVGLISE